MSSLQLAKNTLYLTAASVGQKLLSFVYFLLIARSLLPEQTGAYFLTLSFIVIFLVVADVGTTSVVIRDVAQRPEEAKRSVRLAMAVKIPATALAILAAIAASILLGYDPIVRGLILLATFILIADSFSIFFYGVLRGHHVLAYESVGMFAGQFITLIIGGAVLLTTRSLPVLIAALIAGSTFNFLLSIYQTARRLGWGILLPLWNRKLIAVLLKTALPFFLAAIFVKLYNYIDVQLLYMYLGKATVGLYGVAYKYTYAFQFLPLSFIAALYPGMSRLAHRDHAALAKLFDQALWYMFLLVMPLAFGLWSLAEDAVALTGLEYAAAIPVLQILVFALIPNFLDFPVGSLLNASGRQGTKTILFGIAMVVNFILNLFLIPRFGMLGAAWGSIVSLTVLFLSGLWFVRKILPAFHPLSLLRFAIPMAASGAIMAFVAVSARPWFDAAGDLVAVLLTIAVSVTVYFGLLILFRVLRKSHWENMKRMLNRSPQGYVETPPSHA